MFDKNIYIYVYINVVSTGTSADHNIRTRLRYTDHQAVWNSGIQTNIIEIQNGGSGKKKKRKMQYARTTFETSFLSLNVSMLWFDQTAA